MKRVVPDYYADFACIAGACRHTCCVGWEIDIDPDSLRRYRAMPGEMGERLRSYIDIEETPHFRLTADERCPLLNTNGLCDLITAAGQDALCQICADHPRFRNILSDREETGLGLCCEAAASLILKEKQPVRLLISEGSGPKRHLSRKDAAMLQKRDLWITAVQDRTLSIDARIARLCEMEALQLPACGWADWAQLYLNLERLDPAWEKELTLLCSEKAAVPPADEALQIALEQLLAYLLYRHIAAAEDAHELRPRLAFCLLSTQLLIRLAALHKAEAAFTMDDFCELSRMYSSEIEYSQENMDALLDALWYV